MLTAAALGAPVVDVGKGKGKGKKRNLKNGAGISSEFVDFTVEYAKSNRSKCKLCEQQISKVGLKEFQKISCLFNSLRNIT